TRLKLLAEAPLAGRRKFARGPFAAFTLPVLHLIIPEIERRVGGEAGGISHLEADALRPVPGRNDDGPILGAGAVEGRGGSALQDRHALDVIRVDTAEPVAAIRIAVAPPLANFTIDTKAGIVDGHAVD